MTRRAAFTQADIKRAVQGAIRGGLPVGSFQIVVEDGRLTILPATSTETQREADQADTDWDKALGLM